MRKLLLFVVAGTLFVAGAVRVELVAQEISLESTKEKIEQLDQRFEELAAKVQGLKEIESALKERIEASIAEVTEVARAGNFSEDMQRRRSKLESGDKARELEALDGVQSLGTEGLILMVLAAGRSAHEEVRHQALKSALEVGQDGYAVIGKTFETMSDADRIFLAGQLAKDPRSEHTPVFLCALAKDSSPEVQGAVIDLAAKSEQRVLLFAALGRHLGDDALAKMIEKASQFEGESGLVLLYAVAKKGNSPQRIAAHKAATARKQAGLPILAAAMDCQDPKVRAQLVRSAKAIGGDVAQYAIDIALQDPDPTLREAAKKALKDSPAPSKP